MNSAEPDHTGGAARHAWGELGLSLMVISTGAVSLAAWILPHQKPGAIFGRLSYWQAGMAVALTVAFVSAAVLFVSPACRRRRRAFRMAALGIGVLTTLVLAEVAAWLLPIPQPHDNPWYTFTSGASTMLEGSDELMFERPPHVQWQGISRGDFAIFRDYRDPYGRQVTFRTDHEGFRNSEDIHRADIVFIGDSHTEAGNMPERETFVARTGESLGLRVRNLGRACHSPTSELIILKRFGLKCRPHVVVWQFCENNDLEEEVRFHDWIETGRPGVANLNYDVTRIDAWKSRSLTYRLFTRMRHELPWEFCGTFTDGRDRQHTMLFENMPEDSLSPNGHPGWPLMAQAIEEGAGLLAELEIDLIVVHIPKKLRVMGHSVEFNQRTKEHLPTEWDLDPDETLAQHLAQTCRDLGVPFVNATPSLKSRAADGQMVYLPMDSHLSTHGHVVVAELIAERIATLDLPVETHRSRVEVSIND